MFDLFRKRFHLGANQDVRPPQEKQKDFLDEERIAGDFYPYGTKITNLTYPVKNQFSTSSCVPHAVSLALGIELKKNGQRFVDLSKMFWYRQRTNLPEEGSYLPEIFTFGKTMGAPLFSLLPTPQSESEANRVVLTQEMFNQALIFNALEFYSIQNCKDIDAIARAAFNGHGVPILIYASYREWAQQYPSLVDGSWLTPQNAEVRHCICVLDKGGFVENGKKYVAVQDSALFGNISLRYVSEDFIKARCYGAGYFDSVDLIPGQGTKPKHLFTKTLKNGDRSPEVEWLQKALVFEGLLPKDCITGFFAGRTMAGVKAFQNKYASEILIPLGLDTPTGNVGSATIAKLNSLYS